MTRRDERDRPQTAQGRACRAALLGAMIAVGAALAAPARATAAEPTTARAETAFRMGDYVEAAKAARPLAETGEPRAQFILGELYAKGLGLSQNAYEAVRWYRRAAEQGDALSQAALGQSYEYGRGVGRNYAEAARWYRAGADQGQVQAQFLLGQMYERGYGVAQDTTLAYVWFNLAAENGAASTRAEDVQAKRSAAQRRTSIRFRMSEAEIAEAEELVRAWRPLNSQ